MYLRIIFKVYCLIDADFTIGNLMIKVILAKLRCSTTYIKTTNLRVVNQLIS